MQALFKEYHTKHGNQKLRYMESLRCPRVCLYPICTLINALVGNCLDFALLAKPTIPFTLAYKRNTVFSWCGNSVKECPITQIQTRGQLWTTGVPKAGLLKYLLVHIRMYINSNGIAD